MDKKVTPALRPITVLIIILLLIFLSLPFIIFNRPQKIECIIDEEIIARTSITSEVIERLPGICRFDVEVPYIEYPYLLNDTLLKGKEYFTAFKDKKPLAQIYGSFTSLDIFPASLLCPSEIIIACKCNNQCSGNWIFYYHFPIKEIDAQLFRQVFLDTRKEITFKWLNKFNDETVKERKKHKLPQPIIIGVDHKEKIVHIIDMKVKELEYSGYIFMAEFAKTDKEKRLEAIEERTKELASKLNQTKDIEDIKKIREELLGLKKEREELLKGN